MLNKNSKIMAFRTNSGRKKRLPSFHRSCDSSTDSSISGTDGSRILHTLLVKHYNDLLYRLSSERDKDEVTYVYVGDVFCIHLGTKYADFQEKIFAEISGKKLQTLGIT